MWASAPWWTCKIHIQLGQFYASSHVCELHGLAHIDNETWVVKGQVNNTFQIEALKKLKLEKPVL